MFEKLTARELANKQDSDADDYVLIDTRPEDSYNAWRVEGAKNVPFGPGEPLDDDQRERIEALADGKKILPI